MSYVLLTRTNESPPKSHDARTAVSLWQDYIFPTAVTRHIGISLMIFICACSSWVNAQQSDESENVADACDIEIAPISRQQLAADPEKTRARVIALMLQDMDRCIGLQSSRIVNAQQANVQGATAGTVTATNGSQTNSSEHSATLEQPQTQANQGSVEGATLNTDSTSTSSEEAVDSTLSDILKATSNLPTSIQHNTNIFDLGSDDELVLDDYAKTLHEAYQAETDPVLKEALGKELTNYLNNKKR